jgi:hypothetical protein
MNRTEPHPVELLLLVALVVTVAVVELAVALVEVLQPAGHGLRDVPLPTSARQVRPLLGQLDTHPEAAPPPSVHPLATIANELEALPVTRLRPMAGVRGKRARKAELVAMLAVCC